MREFFRKEKPLLGLEGSGGGLGFFGGEAGPSPITASGGTKTTSGDYTIHTFTNPTSDNFVVSSGRNEIELLVIGGGGAGGSGGPSGWYGAGGGAGGYVTVTGYEVVPGTYPVTVGGGGGGNPNQRGSNGDDSEFNSPAPNASKIVAKGGGGGGYGAQGGSPLGPGNPGGSGGGGGARLPASSQPGGTGTQPSQNPGFSNGTLTQYGFDGGTESGGSGDGRGGGGGGAGGVGKNSPGGSPNGGGGAGRANSISGSSVTYAGGAPTYPGEANPAYGVYGSGGFSSQGGSAGLSGQNGVVIIRYPT